VCFSFRRFGSCAGVAQAADSKLDSVLKRGQLIVGTGSTNAPWHFQGADGKLQGLISTSAACGQGAVQ
jgi:polar amino acid transport system substrate-binding protein